MYALKRIQAEIESLPDFDKQLLLQSNQENSEDRNPNVSCTGNIVQSTKKELDNKLAAEVQDIYYTHPIFNIPYINSIMEELKLSKTRLMVLEQRECYTWHRDFYPRIHIPIITDDEKCFMVVQSKFDPNDNGETKLSTEANRPITKLPDQKREAKHKTIAALTELLTKRYYNLSIAIAKP